MPSGRAATTPSVTMRNEPAQPAAALGGLMVTVGVMLPIPCRTLACAVNMLVAAALATALDWHSIKGSTAASTAESAMAFNWVCIGWARM